MKRFYKTASIREVDGSFSVMLDGRPIKTPAKAELHLPNEALATAIANEWAAQEETVKPFTMPFMRYAATAIDRVTPQREAVIKEIAGFGETDLVCYRATYPENLVEAQKHAWDPLVEWVAKAYDAKLRVTQGVGYVAQEDTALLNMQSVVEEQSDLHLAAIHDVVNLTGSLVVTLAVMAKKLDAEQAFEISEIDETHVIEQWGEDAEQTKRRKNNKESLVAAVNFLELCDR